MPVSKKPAKKQPAKSAAKINKVPKELSNLEGIEKSFKVSPAVRNMLPEIGVPVIKQLPPALWNGAAALLNHEYTLLEKASTGSPSLGTVFHGRLPFMLAALGRRDWTGLADNDDDFEILGIALALLWKSLAWNEQIYNLILPKIDSVAAAQLIAGDANGEYVLYLLGPDQQDKFMNKFGTGSHSLQAMADWCHEVADRPS